MEVLQYAEDMVIDIPKMWTYLAQLIVPLLIGGSVPLSTLATAFKSCLDKACCARLMAEILIIAKEKMVNVLVVIIPVSVYLQTKSFSALCILILLRGIKRALVLT